MTRAATRKRKPPREAKHAAPLSPTPSTAWLSLDDDGLCLIVCVCNPPRSEWHDCDTER